MTGDLRKDIVCGTYRPIVRYCHITGVNDPSNSIHFKFSPYPPFDIASAHSVCEEIGGVLPRLETDLDHYYLTDRMESLLDGITMGQPFSLRYISWPVMIKYVMNIP